MSPATRFSVFLALAITLVSVRAQESTFPATPLASKHFAYPTGICLPKDFCLWAPDPPNSTVADQEGNMVAWCTKPGRGTRLIPNGALQGVQFMRTPDYVQVVGFIDQTQINIAAGDWGGELDPHGADLRDILPIIYIFTLLGIDETVPDVVPQRGNPMGGLMYSTAWSADNDTYTQVIEWHNFMGGNAFCLKACDPAGAHAAEFCQHIYDRIGCAYNAPNNAQNGTFEACLGDDQDYPGIYTENGVVMTYTQPPESLGAISTMPYQPRVPASSSCTTFDSSVLYSALATVSGNQPAATATSTGTASGSAASGTALASSKTSTGAAAAKTDSSASTIAASTLMALAGVAFSAIFLT
ncbi:hypothetical protein H0H92_001422 [Tricholoma furcatifolium]|nr:hypothetical protein H0H92_001422 [Tricholoma furcatifolium]